MQSELEYYYANNLRNFDTIMKDTNEEIINVETCDYNCMGYALGTFEWEDLWNYFSCEDEDFSLLETTAKACVQEILNSYTDIRQVIDPKEVDKDEYAIAFRIGYDDYHFIRQNSDGSWSHKRGPQEIENFNEEDVYADVWCCERLCPYVSTIYFFAVKES